MIALRRRIERGMSHPYLGPVLVLLVLVLTAFVFVHAAHDGHDAAADMGALCLGVVTVLGLVLELRVRSNAPAVLPERRHGRSPPAALSAGLPGPPVAGCASPSPLRL